MLRVWFFMHQNLRSLMRCYIGGVSLEMMNSGSLGLAVTIDKKISQRYHLSITTIKAFYVKNQ